VQFFDFNGLSECPTNECMRILVTKNHFKPICDDSASGACARCVYRVRLPKIELANDRTNCGFSVFSGTPGVAVY
jgi:hypothetical protein